MRLHIDVANDPDDHILISATGPVTIQPNEQAWTFGTDGSLTMPDTTTVSAGFVSGGTGNHTAGIATYSSWNQVYAQDSSVGIQTSADGATYYTWGFDNNGNITFPDSSVQLTAWAGGRVVGVPGSSTGASGDLAGDIAFGTGYFYYCTANYSGTVYNIDSITSSMIARSYLIMYDSNSGFTSNDLSGYTVSGPGGYTGTVSGPSQDQGAGQWYIPVTPDVTQEMGTYTFTSAADIWKRIQWSGDTW